MATLRRTTISIVRPGPNPKSTPQSSPSPVVLSPLSRDFFLIKSIMKNTHALDITSLVAFIFSGFKFTFCSTWSRIARPPGYTQRIKSFTQCFVDVLRNNIRNTLVKIECKPNFTKETADGSMAARDKFLIGRNKLKDRLLNLWHRIRTNDNRSSSIRK
ncbi:hypothetical protein Ahy_Scaffold6g107962 [Arachis hypogaea]|uniref:Uncharacterized protein n=1 Tax=Arachis hypogaea TaxID=3818 RepID=A0A444WPQ7_ARAHY|nr:hypothetical protein Ahy_Scaffold6g107962 [Arachis hypogaea]